MVRIRRIKIFSADRLVIYDITSNTNLDWNTLINGIYRIGIDNWDDTCSNYPDKTITYKYGMLFTSSSNNKNFILQIYYPDQTNEVIIAFRQSYKNNTTDFSSWKYIYTNDYTSISLNQSGYIIFRNGLIIQWGLAPVPDANTNTYITFPISFSMNKPIVIATPTHNGVLGTYPSIIIISGNKSEVGVKSDIAISSGVFWFAIGY